MDVLKKIALLEQEADEFGFKWEKASQIMAQLRSELVEIEVHLKDKNNIKLQEEIGDLFHAAFSLCLFCGFSPEATLQHSIAKFEHRFNKIKAFAKQEGLADLNGQSFDRLMGFWDKAKKD